MRIIKEADLEIFPLCFKYNIKMYVEQFNVAGGIYFFGYAGDGYFTPSVSTVALFKVTPKTSMP